jgi:hypothetical protein
MSLAASPAESRGRIYNDITGTMGATPPFDGL